jgi:hypothetical protein
VEGPVTVTGTTEEVRLDRLRAAGPVRLVDNDTAPVPVVVNASAISGPLDCSGNMPAPVTGDRPNTVSGPSRGQCHGM